MSFLIHHLASPMPSPTVIITTVTHHLLTFYQHCIRIYLVSSALGGQGGPALLLMVACGFSLATVVALVTPLRLQFVKDASPPIAPAAPVPAPSPSDVRTIIEGVATLLPPCPTPAPPVPCPPEPERVNSTALAVELFHAWVRAAPACDDPCIACFWVGVGAGIAVVIGVLYLKAKCSKPALARPHHGRSAPARHGD